MRCFLFPIAAISCVGANLLVPAHPQALAFEARNGRYVFRGAGHALSVASGKATLTLNGATVSLSLAGANPKAALEGLDRMPGKANYILGTSVRESYELYGRVRNREVYPGIDLVFHGNQERLEYDFDIAAGKSPRLIGVRFAGIRSARIDQRGDLILSGEGIEIRQPKPIAYQVIDGTRKQVDVEYALGASNLVTFRLGDYDAGQLLIIDPQLIFENLFGGKGTSSASEVALDSQGNIYVAGQTNSTDFPVQSAAQNHPGAAPLEYSADGGQTWTAPSLGAAGSARSIASSPANPSVLYAATSTGVSVSKDGGTTWTMPANTGLALPVIGVAVDASSPSVVYAATFDSGVYTSTNGGASWAQSTTGLVIPNSTPPSLPQFSGIFASPGTAGTVFAIAEQPDFAYVSTDSGQSWSPVNISPGGGPEAIAFNPQNPNTVYVGQQNGSMFESTDGGNTWAAISAQTVSTPQGLAISPSNPNILLAGSQNELGRSSDGGKTWTNVLALSRGAAAFDPRNPGIAYALDSSGLYRSADAGQTWTKQALPNNIYTAALFVSAANSRVFVGAFAEQDAFVTKWSADGTQVLYSTYLGGSQTDGATGIAVDSSGSAYVTGTTLSSDFPVTSGAPQGSLAGFQNSFIAKLSADGSQLVYATYLGGGFELAGRIAVDSAGEAVVVGSTESSAFPVTSSAFQATLVPGCNQPLASAGYAAYVSKLAANGGSLLFSTLLGGSCESYGNTIALDAKGNVWVGGYTGSEDFPVTKDALQPANAGDIFDGFLASFSPTGSLVYATYIGGPGYDTVTGIAFDKPGNIYLTGTSGGLSESPSAGAFESQAGKDCPIFGLGPDLLYQVVGSAFVLKLDPAAHNNLGLTYLGYPQCLFPTDIAVDSSGEPWIGGTFSPAGSAPQTASPFQIGIGNGFVSQFSADFTQLLFSTYFNAVGGLTVDSSGIAYVAGTGPVTNATSASQAYVAKIDPAPGSISLDSIQNSVNAASPNNSQGIGPGEVLRLLGKNLGPAAPTPGIINGGILVSSVAGVQVTFDGVPEPLLSVSATEIDLIAPFEIAGKPSTVVQVIHNGSKSNAVQVGVSGSPMQVLGVLNPDFTPNSAANPAPAGSVMILYLSGIGQSNPPSQDGQVNSGTLAAPPSPLTVGWAGDNPPRTSVTLPVTFQGSAPGLAAGIFQVNFVAPQQALMNAYVQLASGAGASFNIYVP